MPASEPPLPAPDPTYESRVRRSFERQALMALFGASLARVDPGAVDIAMPFRSDLTPRPAPG